MHWTHSTRLGSLKKRPHTPQILLRHTLSYATGKTRSNGRKRPFKWMLVWWVHTSPMAWRTWRVATGSKVGPGLSVRWVASSVKKFSFRKRHGGMVHQGKR